MKPVYMINGFLESGKTEFIAYTLEQPYFQTKGTTLLIVCEEGENEYDPQVLQRTRTIKEVIEDMEDFNPDALVALEKKYRPERIIIEWNGMWNYREMKLPWYWKIEQQITTIDGSTFPMYYTNMRSLLAEQIKKSELIIMNRCDGLQDTDLNTYKRNIKMVNPTADVIFEDKNGEITTILEEDLPYDLNSDPIVLEDQGYLIWFMDCMDNIERYKGKKLQFVAMAAHPQGMDPEYFVPGRMTMTCCADDMQFLGYACHFKGNEQFKPKQWIKVTATVEREYWADYQGEGPILHAISVEPCKAPKNEVIQ